MLMHRTGRRSTRIPRNDFRRERAGSGSAAGDAGAHRMRTSL
jgi:hypothetical protein